MQQKLESMSAGTDSFAAAMQEVAASSEEQSASTEEIAAAAATLSGAAERLSRLVANLRLDESPTPRDGGQASQPGHATRPAPLSPLAPARSPVTA
jgi:ABC-type transporter Mla subunit MlaD